MNTKNASLKLYIPERQGLSSLLSNHYRSKSDLSFRGHISKKNSIQIESNIIFPEEIKARTIL